MSGCGDDNPARDGLVVLEGKASGVPMAFIFCLLSNLKLSDKKSMSLKYEPSPDSVTTAPPLSSKLGICMTVKARFWPLLPGSARAAIPLGTRGSRVEGPHTRGTSLGGMPREQKMLKGHLPK